MAKITGWSRTHGVLTGEKRVTSRLSEEGTATTLLMYINDIYIPKILEKIISCNNFSQTCVSAKCQYVGNADAAPPKPTKAPVPTNLWCDMSKHWGNVNGNYRIRTTAPDGTMLDSKVRCENGKCTPQRAGPTNACMYICGKIKC